MSDGRVLNSELGMRNAERKKDDRRQIAGERLSSSYSSSSLVLDTGPIHEYERIK
jgi:hypothetical protein